MKIEYLVLLPLVIMATIGLVFIIKYIATCIHKKRTPPIVLFCQSGDAVGIVTKKDFEICSKYYWLYACFDKEKYLGLPATLPEVEPVFVFHKNSHELREILSHCFVEKAVFDVPELPLLSTPHRNQVIFEYLGISL